MLTENTIMYHYCSVDIFMKIMQSNTIWLSHVQTTNDRLDDRMFTASFKRVIKKYKQEDNPNTELLEKLYTGYMKKVDFPYIACFTHSKDLLSQWRAYGDDGRGVCIGFDLSKFSYYDLMNEVHGTNSPIVLIDEVAYHDNDDELIEKLLSASNIFKKQYNVSDEFSLLHTVLKGIDRLSIFLKSEAFREEQEIRMVYFPHYNELLAKLSGSDLSECHGLPIRFRSRGSQIVSYFEYPLAPNSICELIFGPKSEVDYKQLTLFLNQYAPDIRKKNRIHFSEISYR